MFVVLMHVIMQEIICIDSHHKLIRWRLATHGGIDGYSRLIVYLKCMTLSNVKATTIYESFIGAIREYHLPSRVRSDQGGENVLIAQHMIEQRGPNRGSMIVGSSVHNQRIERLWKDMHKCVTSLYYRLFYFMEQCDLLNPLDEKHIYALHYIFSLTELLQNSCTAGIIIRFVLLTSLLTSFSLLEC